MKVSRASKHFPKVKFTRILSANDGGAWGRDPDFDEHDTIVLRSTDQNEHGQWSISEPALRKLSAADRLRTRLHEGDLVMTKSSGSKRHIGKTTIVGRDEAKLGASFSNFMQRFRIKPPNISRYFWYVLQSHGFRDELLLRSTTSTGLANITGGIAASIPVPLPSPSQQRVIADFLDRETAEIDAFIADQERLIELLDERRAAVITHVLTKAGRESDKTRLRFVAKVNPPVPDSVRSRPDTVITFLPMDAIHERGGFDRSQTRKVKQVEKGYSYFANGDVIYAKVTPCFENGKSAVIESLPYSFGFGTTEITVLRPQPALDAKYLLYTLLEDRFRQYGISSMTGAGGLKRVPESAVQDFQFPLPPISKQTQLVGELDRETAAIDAAVSDAQEAIALSRERRAALISAAVTGQLDVSQAQSRGSVGEVLEEEVRV